MTHHPETDIRNETVRLAFQAISRAALPHMDIADAYISDLLWDASSAAYLIEGAVGYLMVRATGTSWFPDAEALLRVAFDPASPFIGSVKVVLRVERHAYRFDVQALWC